MVTRNSITFDGKCRLESNAKCNNGKGNTILRGLYSILAFERGGTQHLRWVVCCVPNVLEKN